jgi:hypothetical protein
MQIAKRKRYGPTHAKQSKAGPNDKITSAHARNQLAAFLTRAGSRQQCASFYRAGSGPRSRENGSLHATRRAAQIGLAAARRRAAGGSVPRRSRIDRQVADSAITTRQVIIAWLKVRVLPPPPRTLGPTEISRNPAIGPEWAGLFSEILSLHRRP